jgi:major vault protein
MFLPDPRKQVVVRRILDLGTVDLLYPGNDEAKRINARYKQLSADLASGEHLPSAESARALVGSNAALRNASDEHGGDSFRRGTGYSPPRMIVLDTKYEGAVAVNIWPGYAVLVTKKTGERRVELGPKMVLLSYDESLMPLALSTGRPKTDDTLFRTAYLRVQNNQVGDVVSVETKDLVRLRVSVSYRVNFVGQSPAEQQKWFGVENYIKILTDHARSRIRNAVKRSGVQEFYNSPIDIVRDAMLGKTPEGGGQRPGLPFTENGMHVYDVEVLEVDIEDENVAKLLVVAQSKALKGAIELSEAQEEATRTEQLEDLKRKGLDAKEETSKRQAELSKASIERLIDQQISEAQGNLKLTVAHNATADVELAGDRKEEEQRIDLARKSAAQELERLEKETEQYVKRMGAISGELVTALQMFGDKSFIEKLVEATGPMALATGVTTADIFSQIFKGTPFENMLKALAERPFKMKVIDGDRAAAD